MPFWDRLTSWALEVAPYFMVTAIFTAVYMFVPNTKVKWKPALIGGLTAGMLWAASARCSRRWSCISTRLTDRVRRLRASSSPRCCGPISAG